MVRFRVASVVVAVAVGIYAPVYALTLHASLAADSRVLINDVSRLNPTHVERIVQGHEVEALQKALEEARHDGLKVSIAGKRHSMGGHAFYKDAVVLDMTAFNQVLAVDPGARTVTVQSGATWGDVIARLNPDDLSVEVMQAYNGFTIGGSLSVNVHESDPNFGPLVESVESFRLLLANGTILDVSRTHNAELFSLVIGGYGLFGVILDVTLHVTPNTVLTKEERVIDYTQYLETFRAIRIAHGELPAGGQGVSISSTTDPSSGAASNAPAASPAKPAPQHLGQIFARLSIAKDDTLLRELVVTTYSVSNQSLAPYKELQTPSQGLKKFVFGLSRMTDFGKDLRWNLQRDHSDLVDDPVISRNNLMDGDLDFLAYTSATDTDTLQEYFVPVENLTPFIDHLRTVVQENDLNLLSATIRYVPRNTESMMAYSRAPEEFGVVLYFNVGTSHGDQAKVQQWARQLIDEAVHLGGAYYLPYVLYASSAELQAAYPNATTFFAAKSRYDPEHLFMNDFYATYAEGTHA